MMEDNIIINTFLDKIKNNLTRIDEINKKLQKIEMVNKKEEVDKRNKLLHIAFSQNELDEIDDYVSKSSHATRTSFIREAILEKIMRIENPGAFGKVSSLQFEMREIQNLQKKQMELHHSFFKKKKEKEQQIPLGYEEFPNDFYQSDEWILRSIEILKRDEWKCQLQGSDCLEIGNIVHHIRSAKHYPKICLDPKNLVCACRNCHDQLYKNYF